MKLRSYWLQHLFSIWKKSSVIWLSGVRRTGKSQLAARIPGAICIDCNLPDYRGSLTEPMPFFEGLGSGATPVLDEFQRLLFPERFLEYGLECGRSMLVTVNAGLSAVLPRFDDSSPELRQIVLPPVLWSECKSVFGITDLDRRLFHGGLPDALLAPEREPGFYTEWIDCYFAGDIQGYFAFRGRDGFMSLFRTVMQQSGGCMDISELSRQTGLCRATVRTHTEAMITTHVLHPIPPFHNHHADEILRMPCTYAFDTGFVAHARGWRWLRPEDRDPLWRHLVLDALRLHHGDMVHYWKTKTGHWIDFVIPQPDGSVDTYHCHTRPEDFRPRSLKSFRRRFPAGRDIVISPFIDEPIGVSVGKWQLELIGMGHLDS